MRADEEEKLEWEREWDLYEADFAVVGGIGLTDVVSRVRVRNYRLGYGPRHREILICLILPKVKVSAVRYALLYVLMISSPYRGVSQVYGPSSQGPRGGTVTIGGDEAYDGVSSS